MKFITVSILIFSMATQAFSKWMILLEFSWNREYIANNLCENKARPQSHCGGKCQLMKKIVEEKESTSTKSPAGKSAFQEVLFTDHAENVFISTPTFVDMPAFAGRKNWCIYSPACSVFHPPLI